MDSSLGPYSKESLRRTLKEGHSLAAVGGPFIDDLAVAVDEDGVKALAGFACLGMAEGDGIADAQSGGCGTGEWWPDFARSLGWGVAQAFGPDGDRQAVFTGRSGSDPATAENGDSVGGGTADDIEEQVQRRGRAETALVLEEFGPVESAARSNLGDRGLGAGGFDGAGAATVDEFQVRPVRAAPRRLRPATGRCPVSIGPAAHGQRALGVCRRRWRPRQLAIHT